MADARSVSVSLVSMPADEYWRAILEQHSPEEVMAELEKMGEEGELPEEQEEVPLFTAARPGVTPFEFIEFTDEIIEHNIDIIVSPPCSPDTRQAHLLMRIHWILQLEGVRSRICERLRAPFRDRCRLHIGWQ